jgi:Cu/Ag efflux pump CusA
LTNKISGVYEGIIRRTVAIPPRAVACVCLVGLAGAVAFPFLKQPSPPRFKDRNIVVQWNGPPGAGLAEMDRITARVTGYLRALPSVSDVAATLGRAVAGDQIVNTNAGQIYAQIRPSADYGSAVAAIRAIVESVPGMKGSVSTYEGDVQAGVLAPAGNELTVRVYGEDYSVLRNLATQVQAQMSRINGIGAAQINLPTLQPNIHVAINDVAAHNAGVLPGDARRQASTLVSGLTVGNFFQQQAVFDVVVWSVPSVRANPAAVRNLPIDTPGGGHVALGKIASITVGPDPIDIQHEALSRYVDVTAPVYVGGVGNAQSAIQHRLSQISFPLQYHAEIVGSTPDNPTSHLRFLSFVIAAMVGILLLLQAALGSWRLAIGFLLALPVSLIGGLLVALLTDQARSLGADVGLLAVFVFAARQGILQIARIRRLHAQDGGELTAAIVSRAAHERLGPALTAVLVSAATMIPFVVMGDVAGNEITHAAAAVILGGLVTATLLNQVLVPAMCLAIGPTAPIAVEEPEDIVDPTTLPAPSPSAS